MAVKTRAVVVGLGSIGRRNARLLKERGDIEVELVEPDAQALERARQELGDLACHDSFDRMLQTDPDIVLIATPHSLHADQTVQALQGGSHVLCEKPMSDSLEAARRMKQAADASGRVLGIGFMLHFHPGLMMLKEVVQEGTLGTILHAHARVGTYVTLVNSLSRYQATQEGALLFDYAHQPDILYWLLKKRPTAVYASGTEAGAMELSSNPNVVAMNFEYDGELISSIHLNYVQMPQRHEYELVGSLGWAVLDVDGGTLRIGRREDSSVTTRTFTVERDSLYRTEHTVFLEAVAGKRPPETSAEDGMVSTAICEAALRSWKERQRVEIET